MNRKETILELALAMGLNVKKSDYDSNYNTSTGTYYCQDDQKSSKQGNKRLA